MLGQGHALHSFDKPLDILLNDNVEEFKTNLKTTFFRIEMFRNIIRQVLQAFNETYKKELPGIPIPEISHKFFSDSAILKIPFIITKNESKNIPLSDLVLRFLYSLYGMTTIISTTILACFSVGFSVRGAIGFGICAELNHETNDIYGTGLADAYHYEYNYADYPRIVATSNLNNAIGYYCDFYNKHQNFFNKNQKKILKFIIDYFKKIFIQDYDGIIILSYFNVLKEQKMAEDIKEDIIQAYQFIEEQIKKFRNDIKIRSKYCKLKNYFLNHIKLIHDPEGKIIDVTLI
jgi:hypothetical protein